MAGNVKFVSYSGAYPHLCGGVLVLNIDGEEVSFGNGHLNGRADYDSFWVSGGHCSLGWDGECDVEENTWIINVDELPEKYQKYGKEIAEVFEDNVPWGCCGGCL